MTLDHDAIYKAYPNVVSIDDGEGAKDSSGNLVTLAQSNIDGARFPRFNRADDPQSD